MLKRRKELEALVAWKHSAFDAGAELEDVARRIVRMAKLIREVREIAARN
jgi:hypothetical protein